jgi:hypothetical protein
VGKASAAASPVPRFESDASLRNPFFIFQPGRRNGSNRLVRSPAEPALSATTLPFTDLTQVSRRETCSFVSFCSPRTTSGESTWSLRTRVSPARRLVAPGRSAAAGRSAATGEEKTRWRFAGRTDVGKCVLQNPAVARGGTRTSRWPL